MGNENIIRIEILDFKTVFVVCIESAIRIELSIEVLTKTTRIKEESKNE